MENNKTKRLIVMSRGDTRALSKQMNVTESCVSHALRYRRASLLMQKIRIAAMKMGATYYESKTPTTEDLCDL
jgi:hypothetical protein